MRVYPECNGKQLKGFKDRSDRFQLTVLTHDYCMEKKIEVLDKLRHGESRRGYCSSLREKCGHSSGQNESQWMCTRID